MMRYDFAKCTNLRWKRGKWSGIIKTDGKNVVILTDNLFLSTYGEMQHQNFDGFTVDTAQSWLSAHPDFEIVPRNPETYKDWQVGDVVISRELHVASDVAARINGLVILSTGDVANATFTCGELFDKGFRLELTDYEKSLINEMSSRCQIKKGEWVLVRNNDGDQWRPGEFNSFEPEASYPYHTGTASGCFHDYKQCIPYNEKTWKLLGTTDDYKEE